MAELSTSKLNELFNEALRRRIAAAEADLRKRLQAELYADREVLDPYHVLHEREVTVDEVLNEGLGCGISPELATEWGVRRATWKPARRRHQGDPQPHYTHQCYQCGLPITHDGMWKDHGGKTTCELTLLDQEMIDTQSYWTDHQPKPWHGEEEDAATT